MKSDPSRKVIIEQHKRFGQSALWRLQREYFDKEGINAWVNQVPFYITSNPFIAHSYAKLVVAFIKDQLVLTPEAKNHIFYIMELGTGSGRFSYYVIKSITNLLAQNSLTDINFCYIMSDFTKNNIKYYEKHPALQNYLAEGKIDFAIFDLENPRSINLLRKNLRLTPDDFFNPLILFANYIFDTVSHDAFMVYEGKLYELLLTLSTSADNMQQNQPQEMDQIHVDYETKEIKTAYYQDTILDNILLDYQNDLTHTSFLLPIASLKALTFLRKLANDKLMLFATDKGYSNLAALDKLGHPTISFHGSFSMMVNFHALAKYFNSQGGDAFLPTPRKGIKTSLFCSGFKFIELPNTYACASECIEDFNPSDYFTLHRRMSDSFNDCPLDALASHLQLSQWDPHIFLKLANRINTLLPEADRDTLIFLRKNMARIAANYYFMPKADCVLFEIGIFFHADKNYAHALEYYLQAKNYIGDQFGLIYNLALCYHHLQKNDLSLAEFKHALTINPDSTETVEWIAFLEKAAPTG